METKPTEVVTVDGVLAKHEINTAAGEVWIRDSLEDPLRIIGLSHEDARQIIIIFRKPC